MEAYSFWNAPVDVVEDALGVGVERRGVHRHEVHRDLAAGGQRRGAVVGGALCCQAERPRVAVTATAASSRTAVTVQSRRGLGRHVRTPLRPARGASA